MSKEAQMLPVWFFVGVLLGIYGAIIFIVALINFHRPNHVALAQYHPDIFGGIILLVIGGLYTALFRPGRRKKE